MNSLSFLKLFLVQPQTKAFEKSETGIGGYLRTRLKGIDAIIAATERFSPIQADVRLDLA